MLTAVCVRLRASSACEANGRGAQDPTYNSIEEHPLTPDEFENFLHRRVSHGRTDYALAPETVLRHLAGPWCWCRIAVRRGGSLVPSGGEELRATSRGQAGDLANRQLAIFRSLLESMLM